MKWLILATTWMQVSYRATSFSFHFNPRVMRHQFRTTRSMSLLSNNAAKQGTADMNKKERTSKLDEAEIESLKQDIKDNQLMIANVSQEIKATENKLLGGKLSPLITSVLTKKYDRLIEEKKALMEQKTIMLKTKSILEGTKTSVTRTGMRPFEFSTKDENFPDSGCGAAIFKREWLFNDIADMVLQKDDEDEYGSYYWRAPAGSGKTVFLKLMGKMLQDRGCVVYYINHSGFLNYFETEYYYQLCSDAGDKTVVFMVDAVQDNTRCGIWTGILREERPRNLLVLGVGIPDLGHPTINMCPTFMYKFPEIRDLFPMFLTERDLPEIVAFFCKESSQPEETIDKLCRQILGHSLTHPLTHSLTH